MSHSSNIFEQRKVQIKNKSGFDLAHSNFLTQTCGTLTPVCVVPMLPNDSISLGFMSQVKLPPMATSFYGRVDYRLEAFFVPYRILWGGWENFLTMPTNDPYGTKTIRPKYLPNLILRGQISDTAFTSLFKRAFGRGSLADYLGFKGLPNIPSSTQTVVNFAVNNIMPFLAYHKIYDDWYRNANIQKPVFTRSDVPAAQLASMPWNPKFTTVTNADTVAGNDGNSGWSESDIDGSNSIFGSFGFNSANNWSNVKVLLGFNDGSDLFTLRQRNWSKDYFTTAALYPQQNGMTGGAGVTSRVSSDSTTFTISQLRQANILQKWLERNNIAGERYADQIRATFGVLPSDAMLDRPIFLGGSNFGIYTNSIAQNAGGDAGSSSNPFRGEVGSDAGQTSGFGKDSLIDKFTATEHGIIMVLGSIVPHQTYSTGTNRMFAMKSFADIPNPMFEGLGEEAVLTSELTPTTFDPNKVFGYVQQYAWCKYMNDEVHGLLVDNESLQSFCLQRSFDQNVKLDSSFIQIPTDYLDQVMSVASKASGFCCWNNMYFDIKKTSLLSQYTIPTLGEQPNTHTETVPNTGRYL